MPRGLSPRVFIVREQPASRSWLCITEVICWGLLIVLSALAHRRAPLRQSEVATVRVGAFDSKFLHLVAILQSFGCGHHVQRRRRLSEAVVELYKVEGGVGHDARGEHHNGEKGPKFCLLRRVGDCAREAIAFGIKGIESPEEFSDYAHGSGGPLEAVMVAVWEFCRLEK